MREQLDQTEGQPPPGEAGGVARGVPLTVDERVGGSPGERPSDAGRHGTRSAIEWAVLIVAAVLIAIVVRTFVFQVFYIPSESMVPTLAVNDRVLVNKLSYRFNDPRRGDVVVFRAPESAATGDVKDLVKRVVGLPDDTIEGRDGHVYINGLLLEEPYLPDGVQSKDFGPVKVPADSYYMLGDNRPYSKDSTAFGPIPRDDFIGRVSMTIWPPNRLSVPLWLVAVAAGIVLAVVLVWVIAGRRRDAHT